jgi:hypothetical protein
MNIPYPVPGGSLLASLTTIFSVSARRVKAGAPQKPVKPHQLDKGRK